MSAPLHLISDPKGFDIPHELEKGVKPMNRKLSLLIAGVLATTMLFGTTVFAASSSTTTNTSSSSVTESAPSSYIVPKNGTAAVANSVRVTSDYSQVTDKAVIATVTAPATTQSAKTATGTSAYDPAAAAVSSYVAAAAPNASKVFGPYKLRMYKAGQSIWSGFGTFNANFGIGNAYDGKTVTVYQLHKDGSVSATTATVAKGKVNLPITEMGTFVMVLN
jgi:hypothetical protein